jgi:hypothetical protein
VSGDYSPAASWPCTWPCDVSSESPTVTGNAVVFASEVLWSLSGQRFGFTTVKLRPSRDLPLDTPYPDAWMSWPGTQPPPLGATGSGGYFDWILPMICTGRQELKLPSPVHAIIEVRVDGTPLVTGAYRLDAAHLLVRVDGSTWPVTNDTRLPDTAVGTWSVTAQYGESVPSGAALAVGELACEFIRGLNGQDCRLPRGVTQLSRQGVTISLPDVSTMFDKGLTGLFFADMFIKAWNPKGLRTRARTYSVDRTPFRRVT